MGYAEPTIRYEETPHARLTDQDGINRYSRRIEHIYARNVERIRGKRILDLACHHGPLAYPLLALGAASVVGVEARDEAITQGREIFDASPYRKQMTFEKGDLFDFLEHCAPGDFDVVTCMGFLYHTVRHADFFREMGRLQPETVFVDTNVAKNYFWIGRKNFGRPPALFVYTDDPARARDTTDTDGIVYWPSTSYLEMMLSGAGYDSQRVNFKQRPTGGWAAMDDYRKGTRAAYVGVRKT